MVKLLKLLKINVLIDDKVQVLSFQGEGGYLVTLMKKIRLQDDSLKYIKNIEGKAKTAACRLISG
jgi:hypothetical protein